MVLGIPFVKFAFLAIRQVSRRIAKVVKNRSKTSPLFTKLCVAPAQGNTRSTVYSE